MHTSLWRLSEKPCVVRRIVQKYSIKMKVTLYVFENELFCERH